MHKILEKMKKDFFKNNNVVLYWDEEEGQFMGFSVKLLQDDFSSSQVRWLGEKLIEVSKELRKKEQEIMK